MSKILIHEGYQYKIGTHGYVYVFNDSAKKWVRTTALSIKEFNREMLKQGR